MKQVNAQGRFGAFFYAHLSNGMVKNFPRGNKPTDFSAENLQENFDIARKFHGQK